MAAIATIDRFNARDDIAAILKLIAQGRLQPASVTAQNADRQFRISA